MDDLVIKTISKLLESNLSDSSRPAKLKGTPASMMSLGVWKS